MGRPGCTDLCVSRCHVMLALSSAFGTFANQTPCLQLNFSDLSTVLQREVAEKERATWGQRFLSSSSLPRTFQIDLNKIQNIAYHFVKLLQAKFGIWQWLFKKKKKMSQITLDTLHLLMWTAQLPILHVNYKIKMKVVILWHSIL